MMLSKRKPGDPEFKNLINQLRERKPTRQAVIRRVDGSEEAVEVFTLSGADYRTLVLGCELALSYAAALKYYEWTEYPLNCVAHIALRLGPFYET